MKTECCNTMMACQIVKKKHSTFNSIFKIILPRGVALSDESGSSVSAPGSPHQNRPLRDPTQSGASARGSTSSALSPRLAPQIY